jgi:hypothetical protein
MSMTKMSIGHVVLVGQEVPDFITIGGRQQVAIHRLPGGARVVDCMGPDDALIVWEGILTGPGSDSRARDLDRIRRLGITQRLRFESYTYQVIINNFSYRYMQQGAVIRYRISCVTLSDATLLNTVSEPVDVAQSVSTSAAIACLSSVTSSLDNLTDISVAYASASSTLASVSSANSAGAGGLGSIRSTISTYIMGLDSSIVEDLSALQAGGSVSPATLSQATQASGLLAAGVQASAYIGQSLLLT